MDQRILPCALQTARDQRLYELCVLHKQRRVNQQDWVLTRNQVLERKLWWRGQTKISKRKVSLLQKEELIKRLWNTEEKQESTIRKRSSRVWFRFSFRFWFWREQVKKKVSAQKKVNKWQEKIAWQPFWFLFWQWSQKWQWFKRPRSLKA
jgi:hypothetical protein